MSNSSDNTLGSPGRQTRNVRTQRLRNFTVQIRHAQQPDRIVGTGVIVSTRGQIITCAHVVRDALGLNNKQHPRDAQGSEVGVYFPQLRNAATKDYRAIIQICFPAPYEDDIVLLQVTGAPPLLGLENVAVLGAADQSEGHEFRSYGYKQLGEQRDSYAEGRILGSVDPPLSIQLHANQIELRTRDVAPGISGAAVLDTERNLVVGLVAKRWNPGDRSFNDNIAWAVDAHVLSFAPFNLPLHSDDLPLGAAPQPRTDIPAAAIQPQLGIDLARVPRMLTQWVGRTELLRHLNTEWTDGQRRIIGLTGLTRVGKTSLARRWLDDVLQSDTPPAGVFWWTFDDNHNLDKFFETALHYLLGDNINLPAFTSANLRAHLTASLLRAERYLLVLDGIEVVQRQTGDQYGEFANSDLREFLQLIAAPDHESLCLITSRVPLTDLYDFTTYTEYEVERLIGGLGGAINDVVSSEDHLGFMDYVVAFTDLIESPYAQPPLTIGIFGSWGMGKSFLLEHIEKELVRRQRNRQRDKQHSSVPPIPRVHVVKFNAWEYSATEIIWPGLVRKIMDRLEAEVSWNFMRRFVTKLRRNLKRQLEDVRGQLIIGFIIVMLLTIIAFWQFNLDLKVISGIILTLGVGGLLKLITDTLSDPLSQWMTKLFQETDYGKHIGYMTEIREDLEVLEKRLRKDNGRILVIIDDLDRCEPHKAVEMLQATKLLLNFESFILCLGIDARIITRAVEDHYKNILGPAGASGYEYLEKIVQIPFRIPYPNLEEVNIFLAKQLGDPQPPTPKKLRSAVSSQTTSSSRPSLASVSSSVTQTSSDKNVTRSPENSTSVQTSNGGGDRVQPADELSLGPILAFSYDELQAFQSLSRYLHPNPRRLKRLVNIYRLVRSLAEYRNEQTILTNPTATIRWLVICDHWPYTAHSMLWHFRKIQEDYEEGRLSTIPTDDPLVYLLEKAIPQLATDKQSNLDHDLEVLVQLLQHQEGRIKWKELEILQRYTINFNPAVEAELNSGIPTKRLGNLPPIINQGNQTNKSSVEPGKTSSSNSVGSVVTDRSSKEDASTGSHTNSATANTSQTHFKIDLSRAPRVLPSWVGRAELLRHLNSIWADGQRRLIGLIGFGGEGKTSLARCWLDDVLQSAIPPAGVFWWTFYDNRNLDEFFEAALRYLLGDSINLAAIPSANLRAHLVAAAIRNGRYLFVLDGIEVVQQFEGDQYGEFASADLHEFLQLVAAPDHESLCLITSRAPLTDLYDFSTYTECAIARLSVRDGRALLRHLGVQGTNEALDSVVRNWDGHALTLTLLATYLVERWQGDVTHVGDVPPPIADEPRYERVQRVLRRYDEHLTEAERAFLTLLSAFRRPVTSSALTKVFRTATDTSELSAPIAALNDAEFEVLLKRLSAHQLLRYNKDKDQYTIHPLIRAHYFVLLTHNPTAPTIHQRIKEYYLELVRGTPTSSTLDDLARLIELVYHACHAGTYDEAWQVFREHIQQPGILVHNLGALETDLALMIEFFPDGDTSYNPLVSDRSAKRSILHEVGFCLMNLGRLREVPPFYKRGNAIATAMEDWHNASVGYHNLTELYIYLGALDQATQAAHESRNFAQRAENKQDECSSQAWQAQVAYLRGDPDTAGAAFAQAEALQHEIDSNTRYLYGLNGIQHADYLQRIGDRAYARRVTETNLTICGENHWPNSRSQCHRVLGDLDATEEQHMSARQHYNEALKIGRSISARYVLIEALLARGRWAARQGNAPEAFGDLNEALDYAVASGYRVYEADIRVALAWAHRAAGDHKAARAEAEQARRMSREMGYHWGQVDAAEVLEVIE